MNIQGCIPRFIRGHGSLILTILSGIGMIATVVATAKVAPKAESELQNELHWKIHHRVDEMMDEAEANGHGSEPEDWTDDEHAELYDRAEQETSLTIMDKIKTAGPIYAPVILLGLCTLGCMAGAQILNTRQQAMMALALSAVTQNFGAYRDEIRKEYGNEADKKAYENARKEIGKLNDEIRQLENIKGVSIFGIATAPGVIFKSDMANIERAFLHFNRNLILRGWGTLEELYEFIGLPKGTPIAQAMDDSYGWNEYLNEVEFGCSFLDYHLDEVEMDNGQKAYLIYFDIPPYLLDRNDLMDGDWDVINDGEYYEGYDYDTAKKLLKSGIEQVPMLIDSASHYVGAPMLCGW